MKLILAILLNLVLLIPSVGIHLDFAACCSTAAEASICHPADSEVSSCCTTSAVSSCDTPSEISIPPIHLDYTSGESMSLPMLEWRTTSTTLLVPRQIESTTRHLAVTPPTSWNRQHQSVFQVFLC